MGLTKFLFRDIVAAMFQPLLLLVESVFVIGCPRFPLSLFHQSLS